jgi:hypothetical protein
MRLKITEAGKAKVETCAFAEKIRKFIEEIKATGGDEETQEKLVVYVVARALTGTEDAPVIAEELLEFVRIHATEIETATSKYLSRAIDPQSEVSTGDEEDFHG